MGVYDMSSGEQVTEEWREHLFGESSKEDMVNSPPHYNQCGIECIDAIRASMSPLEFCGYLKGNAQKYLWRYRYKGKMKEDLEKAHWYLTKLIEEVSKDDTS
tara:strand:- start:437 stop:742 length:306 start_codon:yes stop_codon:yes gene_type:complete